MSIILDALKKLDRERSNRPDGLPDLDGEILRPDLSLHRKRAQIYFATIFVTAVVAAALTYAVVVWVGGPLRSVAPASMTSSLSMHVDNPALPEEGPPPTLVPLASKISSGPKQSVKPASPKVNSAVNPLSSASAPSPPPEKPATPISSEGGPPPKPIHSSPLGSSNPSVQAIPEPPSQEPGRGSGEEVSKGSSKIDNLFEHKVSDLPAAEKIEGQNIVLEKVDAVERERGKSTGPLPNRPTASLPWLRITVIGWDENPSERFAFVNGRMVREGDVIEEAKIVEIYPRRIRFFHNGQYFEIPM